MRKGAMGATLKIFSQAGGLRCNSKEFRKMTLEMNKGRLKG